MRPRRLRIICFNIGLIIACTVIGCTRLTISDTCGSRYPRPLEAGSSQTFLVHTERTCNPSGVLLSPSVFYTFSTSIKKPLADGWVVCKRPTSEGKPCATADPLDTGGFHTDRMDLLSRLVLSLASSSRPLELEGGNWFELAGTSDGGNSYFSVHRYVVTRQYYTPTAPGELLALVNDFPCKYCNNQGVLELTVKGIRNIESK